MKLSRQITVQPPPFSDNAGKITTPEAIIKLKISLEEKAIC